MCLWFVERYVRLSEQERMSKREYKPLLYESVAKGDLIGDVDVGGIAGGIDLTFKITHPLFGFHVLIEAL